MIDQTPDTFTTVLYNCKICGKQGTSSYDPKCPIKDLKAWVSMLTCNPCHDFRSEFRRVGNLIANASYKLMQSRTTLQNDGEAKIRPVIDQLTKKVCSVVCNHYRVTNVWDQSFVDQIMEKPDRAWAFIHFYRKGVEQLAKQARTNESN